jgi:hypothetical protein
MSLSSQMELKAEKCERSVVSALCWSIFLISSSGAHHLVLIQFRAGDWKITGSQQFPESRSLAHSGVRDWCLIHRALNHNQVED